MSAAAGAPSATENATPGLYISRRPTGPASRPPTGRPVGAHAFSPRSAAATAAASASTHTRPAADRLPWCRMVAVRVGHRAPTTVGACAAAGAAVSGMVLARPARTPLAMMTTSETSGTRTTAARAQEPAGAWRLIRRVGVDWPDGQPRQDRQLVPSWPWLPLVSLRLPLPGALADCHAEEARPVAGYLAAVWALLADRQLEVSAVVGGVGDSVAGAPGTTPPVHLVRLGSRAAGVNGDEGEPPTEAREYHHRWQVRGHWRTQPCGPGREQLRRVWVPEHTKGPEGAPLIGEAVVHVLS